MDLVNIAEINRWVLLILMAVTIFWVFRMNNLNDKRIDIAKIELENKKMEATLKRKQIKEQDLVNDIRRKQLKQLEEGN